MASSYDEIIALGPVAYWTGNQPVSTSPIPDETTGNDLTPNGITLEQAGATTELGTAMGFDGTDDWGQVANIADLQATNFTVLAWLYRGGSPFQYMRILSWSSDFSAGHGFNWIVDPANSYATRVEFNGDNFRNGPAIPENTWCFVAVTYADSGTGAGTKYYFDGPLHTDSYTVGDPTYTSTTQLNVGRRTDASRYWVGRMQHLAYFDKVLSAAEIQAIYDGRNTAPSGGGISQAILPAVESSSSITLAKSKSKSLAPASETNESVLIAGQGKSLEIFPAMETNTGINVLASKSRAINFASESDQAILMNPGMIEQPISPASETDSAIIIAKGKSKPILHAQEEDQSRVIETTGDINLEINPAIETDSAIILGKVKTKLLSPASEDDNAVAVVALQDKNVAINTAIETSQSVNIIATKSLAISPATETDSSISLFKSKNLPITYAFEIDIAVRNTEAPLFDYYPMIGSLGIFILHTSDEDYPLIGSSLFELL